MCVGPCMITPAHDRKWPPRAQLIGMNDFRPSLAGPRQAEGTTQKLPEKKKKKEQNHKKMFLFKENVSAADDLM